MIPTKYKIILADPISELGTEYFPTGLSYLSASIKKKLSDKIEIKIVQVSPESITDILELDPDLIGFTAFTHTFYIANKTADSVRKIRPEIKLILGGQHISMAPWSLPKVYDYAVIGEGEESFLRLLHYLLDGEQGSRDKLLGIQYWDNGNLISNRQQPLIDPLDKIPFPDRDNIPDIERKITIDSTRKFNQPGLRIMQLTTSRGCPYKCKFCQPANLWGTFRMHSATYVAEELELIHKRYGITGVHIEDDLFTGNKKRMVELIELLNNKELLGKMSYYVAARTRQIDDEWIELFKDLGVAKVEFGIESGSEKIATYLKKGTASNDQNIEVIQKLNQSGISVYASFIGGSPPETISDLNETWKMMKKIRAIHPNNTCGICLATPFPGTELWDLGISEGYFERENFNWQRLASLARLPESESEMVSINRHIPVKKLLRKLKWINYKLWLGTPSEFISAIPRRLKKIPVKLGLSSIMS
jgi:anaerobic magnesium-protoporphyrin IX monomethyl ester cyclase